MFFHDGDDVMSFVGAIRESPAPDHLGLSRSTLLSQGGDSRIASTQGITLSRNSITSNEQ